MTSDREFPARIVAHCAGDWWPDDAMRPTEMESGEYAEYARADIADDLLAACEAIINDRMSNMRKSLYERGLAAIAKAKGTKERLMNDQPNPPKRIYGQWFPELGHWFFFNAEVFPEQAKRAGTVEYVLVEKEESLPSRALQYSLQNVLTYIRHIAAADSLIYKDIQHVEQWLEFLPQWKENKEEI